MTHYFTTEQVVQIVALACESPQTPGYPLSHWTPMELAAEAIKRGIVKRVSPRSVGRFLKGSYFTTSLSSLLTFELIVTCKKMEKLNSKF